jgi:hypothetical protein
MRTREIECYDYADSLNPPILHRKESFLTADHPLFGKFSRLTRLEEKAGLLNNATTIGTRDEWQSRLRDAGLTLRGHRLCKQAPAVPAENPTGSDPEDFAGGRH